MLTLTAENTPSVREMLNMCSTLLVCITDSLVVTTGLDVDVYIEISKTSGRKI